MIDTTGLVCKSCHNHVLFDREDPEIIDEGGGDTREGRPILECHICEAQFYYSKDEFGNVGLEEC